MEAVLDKCQEAREQVQKRINDTKAALSAKLEDGKIATGRLVRRGRYAVEGGIEDTVHSISRHPFSSIAIAFAAGAALGFLVPRFARK